ncbi:MAG: NAD(+)/NADH kinase, partial [Acidimicrobiia bacterium]
MIIGLVVHPTRPEAAKVGQRFVSAADKLGIEVVAAADDADQLTGVHSDGSAIPDLLVSIGGDGTVLEAVQRGLVLDLPILGINLGRVGFLAEIEQTEIPLML